MNWERIEADLERARRDLLTRDFGPGERVSEMARRQSRAELLRHAAEAFEHEAQALVREGLSLHAAQVRAQAERLLEQAAAEDGESARLEATAAGAAEVARYATIRRRIHHLRDAAAARDLANEILQSARLGRAAIEALWRELFRRCAAQDVRAPHDLESRYRELLGRLDERIEAPAAAPVPAGELVIAAERLLEEAPLLSRPELFDRIVILGGQLKLLQEERGTALGETERQLIRQGFGILTRISKSFQPGWTSTLDSRTVGDDWSAMIVAAEQRLAEREETRRRERESARREQVADALRELHEAERRIVFQEAVERLRAKLYEADAVARPGDDGEVVHVLRDARTQAAIAIRAANGDGERLQRIAQALVGHDGLVEDGRSFRTLRRLLGMEPQEPEPADEGALATEPFEDIDADEVEFTVGDLDERAWPEEILQRRGAGEGERVLLVGGIPNLERRRLLGEFFGWREALWEESYRDRSADFRALRGRLKSGAFDRVIVLSRFCGHDVTQGLREAARSAGVRYHVHPRGVSIPALATYVYSV